MKLYKTITKADDSNEIQWDGTQSDAAGTRKALIAKGFKRAEVETTEVDVPTSKPELLAWLNDNVTGE
jgi:hypothetical protein